MGEIFVVDLHSDFHAYLQDPEFYLPEKLSNRGRTPVRYQTDQKSSEVLSIVKTIPEKDWKKLTLRKTTRGDLKVRACRFAVYVWDGESKNPKQWFLIATKSVDDDSDLKISLTNAPEELPLRRLAWMQRQRYWVERAFEDAKSECGMADYQVRKWNAWHHHMALVMMAMLFMLSEKIKHKDSYPLLSCADIEDLLAHFLPQRNITKEDVIRQLEHRHRQRSDAIDSHTHRQKNRSG